MWDTIWTILEPNLPVIIGGVIALVIGFMVKKGWVSADLGKKLELDVSGAVTEVYHEYVAALKKGREDGKLTEEEKKHARDLAIAKVKELGKEKGVDYAKTYGLPAIMALIEKFVTKKKEGTE